MFVGYVTSERKAKKDLKNILERYFYDEDKDEFKRNIRYASDEIFSYFKNIVFNFDK